MLYCTIRDTKAYHDWQHRYKFLDLPIQHRDESLIDDIPYSPQVAPGVFFPYRNFSCP